MRSAATAFVLMLITISPALAQGNLGWLKNSPIAHFKQEDLKLMQEAAITVLESNEEGAHQSWENTATGNSGAITALSSHTNAEGRACKRLRIENRAQSRTGSSTQTVCQSVQGTWKFDPYAGH